MKRKLNKGTSLLIIFPEAQMDLFFSAGENSLNDTRASVWFAPALTLQNCFL